MPKLSRKIIGDIRKPKHGQVIYRDNELTGFGLRVTPGSMSYICECRVNGKMQRKTLARVDLLTPEEARKQARRLLAEMGARNERKPFKVPTLAEVLAEYPTKKRLRESTLTNYRQVIHRYLSDWEHLPVTNISKEMVFTRHRELRDKVSGGYANMVMQVLPSVSIMDETLGIRSFKLSGKGKHIECIRSTIYRLHDAQASGRRAA